MIHAEAATYKGMKLKDVPETSRCAFIHNIPNAQPNVGFHGGKFYNITWKEWDATWHETPYGSTIYYNDVTGHVWIE